MVTGDEMLRDFGSRGGTFPAKAGLSRLILGRCPRFPQPHRTGGGAKHSGGPFRNTLQAGGGFKLFRAPRAGGRGTGNPFCGFFRGSCPDTGSFAFRENAGVPHGRKAIG